ncbi:oxygen-dependent coproporphyrinogen oxidase [Vibrio sp. SS-MA-C1-2]|uniref:oxygen-dependent coproporphyrinogen oxidase n=1 Tax=Vibrio sp. SS-MA-C1-2 TaxID=2908646 RepID=UPI001F196A56|nr:oxygen-dependent coproporphyrinogen oxidase [Vibrio sp. SS-MA-C1-2]UJF17288.1 oxygen-dependent coproporphyrinogen oxidase [Vibrio sp. SS-MA-C1-2]
MAIKTEEIKQFLLSLQQQIIAGLENHEPTAKFEIDQWQSQLGEGKTSILRDGQYFESAGVNFSSVSAPALPSAATKERQHLVGLPFIAMGVSLVIHPLNPHVPTSHANIRFFCATDKEGKDHWWFGGGLDLTPYQLYQQDVVHFHQVCQTACQPFGDDVYAQYKQQCDDYFFLPHRNEHRGVGGLFFDDLNQWGFERSFDFIKAIGGAFTEAYLPIVERCKDFPYTQQQREFQLFRRGRYVEFNLLQDRGTIFGIQSKGRTKSILMSMPPKVNWHYDDLEPQDPAQQALVESVSECREWL